jgi:rubrerythrin
MKNEWLLIHGENYFTLIEEYLCSECEQIVSGFPPESCPHCGSTNEYRGHAITARMEAK